MGVPSKLNIKKEEFIGGSSLIHVEPEPEPKVIFEKEKKQQVEQQVEQPVQKPKTNNKNIRDYLNNKFILVILLILINVVYFENHVFTQFQKTIINVVLSIISILVLINA